MNKQFGYFPKEAVKEEQKFVTKEIVVETQESDFLCMDDTGYPIDSSHLDTEDDYDSDLKTLPEKSEMSQTRKYTDETKSETPTSKDTASESLSTAGEEVEYQDNGGAKTNQESPETAVELKEKGGSPASSWLSSSVTEWFDGGNWDEPDNSAEVKKHLMQGDYSLMSSVTGWLRLGNKGKTDSPEDSENHQQNDRKTESFTSAMTGWLGFSGDEKAESCEEKEYDDEKEMDMKTASADNFKSRKLNLNSETQQIQEKINEMGTLGWLGNGLSRTLGFGINDQDTGNTIQVIAEEGEKIDKQKASSSWFDVEIKDILGFRKENPADTTETDTKSSRNVQGHDNRAASVDSKHRELADTSQVDQNNNPPQNQKVDMYPILNGKEGENKFDILASKNDVTSMPTFTYMVSKSVGQVVSEIKDSKKDQIEENDDPEFTKQVENIGTSNIQSIYGAADVECKGERTVTEIKFDESAKQSQVQESGSSLESETVVKESEKDKKQEEVHTKKVENIEKQQNVEYTKVGVQNKFQEKTQGEFKKGVIQKNWKVTYNNTNEDENSLEFGSDFFEKKDAEMTHENLSEQDKEKHLHENTPSQDTKNMESPYLQGTVTSVINFLKESSFVSYLGPESEDNEYKEEEHKELGEGEEQNEIMKMEEQEDSQVLTEKWKETVRRQRKKQQDLISREKQKPLEELKFKTPEHLTEVERVYYRKHGEFIEKTKEEDVALKDTKEGITELIQKEQIETFDNEKHKEFKQVDKQEEMQMLDHKHEVVGASVMKIQNKLFALDDLEWDMSEERDKLTNIVIDEMDGKLGNFTQKEEADEFEDEKQEGFERGKRGEVVIVLGEKTQEVVEGLNEEKLEDFVDKQEEVGELEETKYQVSGESEEAFEGERQEELEPKEQVGQRFEKTHKGDSESSGLLEDKGQEDFKDREWKEVQKLEKYEVDSKPREELEEKENMEEIKVKQQSKVGKLEKRYEMRSESGDGMEQKKHEEVEMLKYDEDGESEGLEEKDNMEINVNQNEVGKLEKKYEVSGEPGEELQEKSLQMKHKKQEEVEKLEKYEVDGESVENLEEEHIYVKQEEVEKLEKKYEVSGESREELDHKGKEKFKDRDLEKLEKLEKYDVNVESIERFENKMQENFTDKEQEGVEKLDKVEKDYDSGEDLQEKEKMEAVKIKKEKEARDSEEPNQFEPRKQEDLYKGLNRTEVEEKRKGGVRKWKHVELVQIKEEETQEFNRDLKVSEDIHVSEFVERRDVKEVIESVECMDKLCTQIDQNEVITERGEHSFEDDSNKVTKGSGGIFGLFNKVISLDQRPINKMKELTNSHAAFAGKANEMLKEKPFQTPKEELDATTNNDKDLQENFLPPSPSLTQNSQSSFLLSNTAKTHQPKPLPNNYKILQDYVGREEATILVELFGAKKLKLLDYILGHPDVFTEDVDESIVLDTETLLHYCREELFTASIQLSDAPGDKENTRTIFAIQKVQILLKRARETFNARKSAINRANSQARPSYVDASCPACSKDQETARVMVGKQKDGGPEKNEKNTGRCEEISLVEKANKLSHSQTVPSELLEGVMLQPDVIHHIQEQSSSQTHAMKDFLKWLKLQVPVIDEFRQFNQLLAVG